MLNKRRVAKALIYRAITFTCSLFVALIITGDLVFSIGYTLLWEVIINTIIYYIFDYLWSRKKENESH